MQASNPVHIRYRTAVITLPRIEKIKEFCKMIEIIADTFKSVVALDVWIDLFVKQSDLDVF
jgi:hypothetical protein